LIKNDAWIKESGIIKPFCPYKVSDNVISYGTSQAGYDLSLSQIGAYKLIPVDTKAFENELIDPKKFDKERLTRKMEVYESKNGVYYYLNARSQMLGAVKEELNMPNDIMGLVWGKSTYSRCGVNIYCQPVEPGWRGHLSILIVNYNQAPIKIYANEGIAQIVFFELIGDSETPYSGKYQNQKAGPTLAKI